MNLRMIVCSMMFALACVPAIAQDAKAVIANATRAMGLDGVDSVYYFGSGANFTVGQNNNANNPWPRTNLNDYVRVIDFSQPASRATWSTYAIAPTGGAAVLVAAQQNITPAAPGGPALQLEIWITPWGFLKGAAANNATVRRRSVDGKRYQVLTWNAPVKSPGGQPYRLVGYINSDNLVEKVQTWVENPVLGDMLVECEYRYYRDSDGLKFPTAVLQKRAGWPVFELQVVGAFKNPPQLQRLLTAAAPPPAGALPGIAPAGAIPPTPLSEKLADGVFRIRGAYNSLAIEFADHVLLFEPGPQNEARALAGIAETRRLFPGKPIRYGVISHHHFDHTGGLEAVAAEGITIVTPEVNKAFLDKALSAPRTLAPDALARSGRKPVIEGFKGDKRVFEDAMRTVEIHVIKGLPHADGMVVAWLPKEKILAYADLFTLPPAASPVPDPPIVSTQVFVDNLTRLGIEPERILSVHTLVPERMVTLQEMRASLGLKN